VRLLPRHVQSNLPGKVLFFHVLGLVSVNPTFLGFAIVFCANVSAAIVYTIARLLRADIATAWLASLFAVMTPANILFQPILNTVSPLPILLALALFIGALTRWPQQWGLIAGAVLFFTLLFDPLTFALGTPGGHLKIPHPWPPQTPPPDECGTRVRGCYEGDGRFATRAAASFSRQLLPSNLSRCP